jgi:Protein of unknown function (DUF2818)
MMTKVILFFIAFFAANLPWMSNQFLYFIPLKATNKNLAWSLLELIVLYFVVLGIAFYAEYASFGTLAPQGWEFYSVTACLFLVLTFPGFIYRILWKK